MTTLSDLVRLRKAAKEAEIARSKATGEEWKRLVRYETHNLGDYRRACDSFLDAMPEAVAETIDALIAKQDQAKVGAG